MVEIARAAKMPITEYVGMVTDSKRWADYQPKSGDVVVSTPPKSGTTWMQGILALLFSGDPNVDANPSVNSPWIDNRLRDFEEMNAHLAGLTGRRHVKSHTPLDGIPLWRDVFYITVYRHPIDVHFSSRKHVANYQPEVADFLGISENTFPSDPRESFHRFLENDDMDHGSLKTIVHHYKRCLDFEPRDTLLRLHYADMKRDLPGTMSKVASHVDVQHPAKTMNRLVEAASFENMKSNADRFAVAAGNGFWRSDAGFFDSATSNKWEGVLTEDDLATYDRVISELLEPEQRSWLEWGSSGNDLAAGD